MNQMRVKPLVWEDRASGGCVYRIAEHPEWGFGIQYRIQRFPLDHPFQPGKWEATHFHPHWLCSRHNTAEEAMAACEQHYERRVWALLEPQP